MDVIKYNDFQWKICGDFKMIGILLGMQGGFTKHCCFLCLWDSRATSEHYKKKIWPRRINYIPGKCNISYIPLVDKDKILLPPLHIKIGLIKIFVKALAKSNSKGFQYLLNAFPKISYEKKNQGVFDGPQIREMLSFNDFEETLNKSEKKLG